MKRRRSHAIVCLALAALMLRALLPEGWMPSSGDGAVLTICTMDGPVRMAVDDHGQPLKKQPAGHDSASQGVCPFAAAQHFATSGGALTVMAPPVAFLVPFRPAVFVTPHRRAPYTPQSLRGPPAFA
jgi:hypothetical protein